MYYVGDTMKKRMLMLLGFVMLPIQIKASSSIFEFGYTSIEVPYKADLNPYFDRVYQSIRLKSGYHDPNFSVEDENDGFFKSVINSNRLATYRLKYKAYAPKYYQEETQFVEFIIVDKEPPEVIYSEPIVTLLDGAKPNYNQYIRAKDNETKSEDLVIEYNDDNVDYQHVGHYEVIYTISDNSLNKTYHTATVDVVDKIKPTILKTELSTHQTGFSFYIEDHFIIKDNYDQNPIITYQIEGSLELVGDVLIHVEVTDNSNNKALLTKRIRVVDNIPPTLTLNKTNLTIPVYSEPLDLWQYIDTIGKGLTTKNISIEEAINYEQIGIYEVTYILEDAYHNETKKTLSVKVVDKAPPIVHSKDLVIDLNDPVNLETGVYVEDNYSTDIKVTIFDTNFKHAPGTYYVIYQVVDEAGNHTYHERTITIKGKTQAQNIYIYTAIVVGIALVSVGGFILYKKRKSP